MTDWTAVGLAGAEELGADARFTFARGRVRGEDVLVAVPRSTVSAAALRAREAALARLPKAWEQGPTARVISEGSVAALAVPWRPSAPWQVSGPRSGDAEKRVRAAAAAIAAMHASGAAHGALSPMTLRVCDDGAVWLPFAGYASVVRPTGTAGSDLAWRGPEAVGGGRVDARLADVFAWGVAAHLALGGGLWLEGGQRAWRAVGLGRSEWPRLSERGTSVGAEFAEVVDRALARPLRRISNGAVLTGLLGAVRDGAAGVSEPPPEAVVPVAGRGGARRPGVWAYGAVGVLVVGAAVCAVVAEGDGGPERGYVPSCDTAMDCAPGLRCESGTCQLPGYAYLPPATIEVGSRPGQVRGRSEPSFNATFSGGVYVADREVTQGEWRELMGNNPSWFAGCGDACPVESVSWYDAIAFANAASEAAGLPSCYVLDECEGTPGGGCPDLVPTAENLHFCEGDFRCGQVTFAGLDCPGYRLPTELEWEYAARGGTNTAIYAGELGGRRETRSEDRELWSTIAVTAYDSEVTYDGAWPCELIERRRAEEGSTCGPSPVASLVPNAYGVYDALGNVAEWTYDAWRPNPRARPGDECRNARIGPSGEPECEMPDVTDHFVEAAGGARATRGGAWFHSRWAARAASRSPAESTRRWVDIGFRLARSAAPPGAATAENF